MLKKICVGFSIFVVVLYILFLLVPFCLTGLANNYSEQISKFISDVSGLKVEFKDIRFVTTPKLTVGLKFGQLKVSMAENEPLITAENVRGKVSLFPFIIKKVEIDMIGADKLDVMLKVKPDGKFLLEDYFVPEDAHEKVAESVNLPFGFRLSNKLPDIKVNDYDIALIEIGNNNTYHIKGDKFFVKDFVLNKNIRLQTTGSFILVDREQFKYDIKLSNKIMPELDLHDVVFAPKTDAVAVQTQSINVLDILKSIHKNGITGNLTADVKTSGKLDDVNLLGKANISNISVLVNGKPLPPSNFDFVLKDNKVKMSSEIYTGENETTKLAGNFFTGKHSKIDLNCVSNAKLNSVIDIIDSIAKTFGYKDFDTLSATGALNADFTLKSDFKKLETSGYLKVPSASINYKLYNTSVDNIFADVSLDNNLINIKNAGFSILNQPLTIKGTVSQNSDADLSLVADKLQIKGLLIALGQAGILKDNNISSGTLSVNALLKGKLDKLFPKVDVSIDNLNVKNIPMNMTVKAPSVKLSVGEKDILVNNGYIILNNSKINYSGKILNYLTKNINFDIKANGNILASDLKAFAPADYRSEVATAGALPLSVSVNGNDKSQDIVFSLTSNPSNYAAFVSVDDLKGKTTLIKGNIKLSGDNLKFENAGVFSNGTQIAALKGGISDLYKSQKLNLNVSTLKNVSVVIPFFKKSKMVIGANIDILGNTINPLLKGNVSLPSVKIPELTVTMDNLEATLNGPIAKGKGTLKKIVSGGIVAENLSSDFNLTNNIFYLKNMAGDCFAGKINGNISYNIGNGHIGVDLKAEGMNAETAIRGAAGIKNALSGTLGFNANVTLHGATDVEMIKNLKGKASFNISDGEFGNLGRFENMLFAQNLMTNPIIKGAVNSVQALPTIKNTAKFKTITGNMTFNEGWAYLDPIKTSGPSMSYYIVGKYNILNATANVAILGRISAEVVSLLGPLGELSVTKLTSYIPVLGKATGILINALTMDPATERTSFIPPLSSGETKFKDFKVEFNGGVESKSSIKSFKWLSKCDTSELESLTLKEQIEKTKETVQEIRQQQIDAFNKKLEEQRQQAQEARQQMLDAKEGLKNLFKKTEPQTTPSETTTSTESPVENVQGSDTQTPSTEPTKTIENSDVKPNSDE